MPLLSQQGRGRLKQSWNRHYGRPKVPSYEEEIIVSVCLQCVGKQNSRVCYLPAKKAEVVMPIAVAARIEIDAGEAIFLLRVCIRTVANANMYLAEMGEAKMSSQSLI